MKTFLYFVAVLEIAILSPLPALERWQADYRARVRASLYDYLPENPSSTEARALLRDICALPDAAFRPAEEKL